MLSLEHKKTHFHTHLFKQKSIVAEDSQRGPSVITSNIKFLSTANLHSKHMALWNSKQQNN